MPDYGTRTPPGFNGTTWGLLGAGPYGWTGLTGPRNDNVPISDGYPLDQFLYERLDWADFVKIAQTQLLNGVTSRTGGIDPSTLSNPPFLGAGQLTAGRVPEWMLGKDGRTRIVRGYIRRQERTPGDPRLAARLFFMWNPEQIERVYTGYMDSNAYDPSNATGTAQNLISAAKQTALVNFSLFFDRQLEVAIDARHPGVLLDLQCFDTIVQGGSPGQRWWGVGDQATGQDPKDPTAAGPQSVVASDAGNVALNNIKITIVFSPQIAYDGVITGANVVFEKFSHSMVPVWMHLSLTIQLYNTGQDTGQTVVSPSEQQAAADQTAITSAITDKGKGLSQAQIDTYNAEARFNALTWAQQWTSPKAQYNEHELRNDGPPQNDKTPVYFDCSSLVWRSYNAMGYTDALGWGKSPYDTGAFKSALNKAMTNLLVTQGSSDPTKVDASSAPMVLIAGTNENGDKQGNIQNIQKGDLMLRTHGTYHIEFVADVSGATGSVTDITGYGAHSPGEGVCADKHSTPIGQVLSDYDYVFRVQPVHK